MRQRALSGRARAYQVCARCGHMRVLHEDHGFGRCSSAMAKSTVNLAGELVTQTVRCGCHGFTTERNDRS